MGDVGLPTNVPMWEHQLFCPNYFKQTYIRNKMLTQCCLQSFLKFRYKLLSNIIQYNLLNKSIYETNHSVMKSLDDYYTKTVNFIDKLCNKCNILHNKYKQAHNMQIIVIIPRRTETYRGCQITIYTLS